MAEENTFKTETTESHKYEQDTAADFTQTPQNCEDLPSSADLAAYGTTAEEKKPCAKSANTAAPRVEEEVEREFSTAAPGTASSDSSDFKKSNDERKERTRKLINMGGLIVKAELEVLSSSTLYGGLLTLRNQLAGKSKEDMYKVLNEWTYLGKQQFKEERSKGDCVALRFKEMPPKEVLEKLKAAGLRWNPLRKEWEGVTRDLNALKSEFGSADYDLQIL